MDADDAWSETFLSAMKAYPDLPADANIEAWLVTIAHRKAIDLIRAAARRAIPVADHPDTTATIDADPHRHDDLTAAVAALPPKQKQAVAYHYLAGLPYTDVAAILGGTTEAARRSAADGVATLRRSIRAHHTERTTPMTMDDLTRDLAGPSPRLPITWPDCTPASPRPPRPRAARHRLPHRGLPRRPPTACRHQHRPAARRLRHRKPRQRSCSTCPSGSVPGSCTPGPLDPPPASSTSTSPGAGFDLPLDWRLSAGFRAVVLRHLPEIAYGHTASYATVAGLAGNPKAVRAVGTACATNPLPVVVPCHRVVGADGGMGGYLGGARGQSHSAHLGVGSMSTTRKSAAAPAADSLPQSGSKPARPSSIKDAARLPTWDARVQAADWDRIQGIWTTTAAPSPERCSPRPMRRHRRALPRRHPLPYHRQHGPAPIR